MDNVVPERPRICGGVKHFYQDNQSAILLEKNGRGSCGDKSRHINIRYFFIEQKTSNGLHHGLNLYAKLKENDKGKVISEIISLSIVNFIFRYRSST